MLAPGYQYLTETRFDQIEPILESVRRDVVALGLPLRSVEIELGPSQCEFTFQPQVGLAPADTMMLFRSAVKQTCRRQGLSRELHVPAETTERDVERLASAPVVARPASRHQCVHGARRWPLLSPIGRRTISRACSRMRAPPRRSPRRPSTATSAIAQYALAPDRVIWGHDNRGVMVRALGGAGDTATRLENRVGEPAANPYLYMASQIVTGLDGIARKLDPGPSADTPYETVAPLLPKSLEEALAALRDDTCFADGFGKGFIDYFLRIKQAEIARYQSEVTEWEQKEYFELF